MHNFNFNFNVCGRELNVYNERYDDIFEWFNVIESRKLNEWCERSYGEGEEENDDWYGCPTYEEAKAFLAQGIKKYNEDYEKISYNYFQGIKIQKSKAINSVIGQQVSVPRFLQNHPKMMIKKEYLQRSTKKLDILLIPGVSAIIDSDEIFSMSYSLFGFFKLLYENDYIFNVSLLYSFMGPSNRETNAYNCIIRAKENNDSLSNSIISLCSGLPSTFRKIAFRWYESYPNATLIYGYGQPLTTMLSDEDILRYLDELNYDTNNIFVIDFRGLYNKFGSNFKPQELLQFFEEQRNKGAK